MNIDKRELEIAEEFARRVESELDSGAAAVATEADTQLASLLREANEESLPPASPELLAKVVETIEESEAAHVQSKTNVSRSRKNRRGWAIGLVASLLFVMLGALTVQQIGWLGEGGVALAPNQASELADADLNEDVRTESAAEIAMEPLDASAAESGVTEEAESPSLVRSQKSGIAAEKSQPGNGTNKDRSAPSASVRGGIVNDTTVPEMDSLAVVPRMKSGSSDEGKKPLTEAAPEAARKEMTSSMQQGKVNKRENLGQTRQTAGESVPSPSVDKMVANAERTSGSLNELERQSRRHPVPGELGAIVGGQPDSKNNMKQPQTFFKTDDSQKPQSDPFSKAQPQGNPSRATVGLIDSKGVKGRQASEGSTLQFGANPGAQPMDFARRSAVGGAAGDLGVRVGSLGGAQVVDGGLGGGGFGGGGLGGGGLGGGGGGLGGRDTRGQWEYRYESRKGFGRGGGRTGDDGDDRYRPRRYDPANHEQYELVPENDFQNTLGTSAISTFSVDVDTASYANLRRMINDGQVPPPAAVRIEEMINYFNYQDPQPEGDQPFAINMELAECPWQPANRLLRVSLKAKSLDQPDPKAVDLQKKLKATVEMISQVQIERQSLVESLGDGHPQIKSSDEQLEVLQSRQQALESQLEELPESTRQRPASNVVLLIDVSGSMNKPNKLPLLKQGFSQLIRQMRPQDRISIVTYAGSAKIALQPTAGDQQTTIQAAIDSLSAGGSTHGSAGIEMAYELAQQNFIPEGVNKVILATDGDLNVGVTSDDALVKLIEEKCSEGVFLTVLGFGTGNLKDAKMEKVADHGNGVYAYIDSVREARKVLVEEMQGALVTVAKDVKLQLEFNPAQVSSYRLIGYENRMLQTQDFDNDQKDAGEIGAGHSVTALYELVPATGSQEVAVAKDMRYQQASEGVTAKLDEDALTDAAKSGEVLTLALRFKRPDASESELREFTLKKPPVSFTEASDDFRFAAGVAAFGMHLRRSTHDGRSNLKMIENIIGSSLGEDGGGYRAELLDLIRKYRELR